jgi:hypothetical protein
MLIKDLKYDGLPIIYDIEEDSISICIIEEYISGKSLEEYIRENGTLAIEDVVDIGVCVCNIVEYLHEQANIVHLDIKPANIIVHEEMSQREKRLSVHLIDFDSSRRRDSEESSSYGTPGYAAPEQYFGRGNPASDIYSIGILIAYMAGRRQGQSVNDDIRDVCYHYSNSIGPVIRKCLRHNQNQRYKSINQLKSDLENIKKIPSMHYSKNDNSAQGTHGGVTNVYVSGTRHGIGTTHFCLCMASFLAKNGKTCVVIRHGDNDDLKSEKIHKLMKKGVITHGGVIIRPEYSGTVAEDYGECAYHIHDCGTDTKNHRNGMNILVGDCGYRRGDYDIMDKSEENTIIFINHISGQDFYRYSRSRGNCYRFPCMYRWDERNRLFEEELLEIFKLQRKKWWAGWRWQA